MTRRHQQIAEALRREITDGRLPVGSALPSETELAAAHGVSRGTVRQALAALLAEGLIGSRQGARHLVLSTAPSQSFTELRSFAQWARAGGHTPGGQVLDSARGAADREEAALLQLRRAPRCCGCCGCGPWTASRCCWSARSTRAGSRRPSRSCRPTASRSPRRSWTPAAWSSPTASTTWTPSRRAPWTPGSCGCDGAARCCACAAPRPRRRAARSRPRTTATAPARWSSPSATPPRPTRLARTTAE